MISATWKGSSSSRGVIENEDTQKIERYGLYFYTSKDTDRRKKETKVNIGREEVLSYSWKKMLRAQNRLSLLSEFLSSLAYLEYMHQVLNISFPCDRCCNE